MFGFIISLVLIFEGVVITSAKMCYQYQDFSAYDSYCNDNIEIKYPFWFDDDLYTDGLNHCGYPGFEIKCVENETIAVMNISNQLYRAINIDYQKGFVRVEELDIYREECPHPRQNSSQEFGSLLSYPIYEIYNWTLFYNCSDPPNNKDAEKFHVACLDNSGRRSYAFPFEVDFLYGFNWYGNCEDTLVAPGTGHGSFEIPLNYTLSTKQGFVLEWSTPIGDCKNCESSGGRCSYNTKGEFYKCNCGDGFFAEFDKSCPPKGLSTGVKVLICVFTGFGILLVVLVLAYITYRRSNIKSSTNVETFLESCGNLALQRFKYSNIKKMTNSFKDTLGKGGYGCVFKGKLMREGRLVAVKILNESKGNGEDFINEVATIGRTNHVNVVSLLGYCIEGTKRALVYEFMPNGSLERFIYNEKTSTTPLGWEKLYQIALGIARGLEYLHRGCNTRILHFDIKPHNILLDQEFCPKISDFGLAKLCPTRESVVSMLDARGTIGYIAPEVYCRNFGGVSHKSDVYSYGMLVFEIIGGRKNIDPTVENMSEIYFPQWIYNHLNQDINVEGSMEILEDETTKKMFLVALWCVQTHPADRPSISKVVEMLEGSMEDLQMPPNPFQDPPSRSSPG